MLGLAFMAHRLKIVPIRTDDECCVVIGVIVGTDARCAIIFAPCLQRSAIEIINLPACLSDERNVKWHRRPRSLAQTQRSIVSTVQFDSVRRLTLGPGFDTQRLEYFQKKALACR